MTTGAMHRGDGLSRLSVCTRRAIVLREETFREGKIRRDDGRGDDDDKWPISPAEQVPENP